jgi:outer membrane protein assembly factor BamD
MIRRYCNLAFVLAGLMFFVLPECYAPLVYRPGEGWSYEPVGGGRWERTRAKDQLQVAQEAFAKKDYRLALKAARRVVKRWPYSDYAPEAQYLIGRCYEARHMDEKAFKEYQTLLEKYPKVDMYQEVIKRQFAIANRFLAGQWFRVLFGYIPLYPSMEKTCGLFEKIIKNGPYSQEGIQSQMNIGKAREKQKKWDDAVKAYEKAADRYHDYKQVAADALFNAGLALNKEAKKSDYDQSIAQKAINTFSDFITLNPEDPRVNEAREFIKLLKTEQARGSFNIAQYYESKKKWSGALVYYNDVIIKDPDSKYATIAREKIQSIKATQQKAAQHK